MARTESTGSQIMSDQAQDAPQKPMAQLSIERIYLKDASFESPGAPVIFTEQFRPEYQVDINPRVNSLGDNRHEVVLTATVTATRPEDRTAYIAEVHQAGIFQVTGVEAAALQQVLGIACPTTLFPYLRETLDTMVVKGSFPPLQLAPVNFEMLYAQALQQAQAAAQAGEAAPAADPDVKH